MTAIVRRPLGRTHAKLTEVVADFDRLDAHGDAFAADDVFCCLGTTIKTAGSQDAFRKVDHDYVVCSAEEARKQGARRFLLVSAVGADPGSRIFYSRVKGEAERDVSTQAFEGVALLRPGLLLGDRAEHRAGEAFAQKLAPVVAPLLIGPLRKYRAISARTVARAMLRLAKDDVTGVRVVENDEIEALGR